MSQVQGAAPSAFSLDDDDEWQSMPVETFSSVDDFAKPDAYANPGDLPYGDEDDDSSDPDDPRRFQSWPSRSSNAARPSFSLKGAKGASDAGAAAASKPKKGSWIRSRFSSSSGSAATASAKAASGADSATASSSSMSSSGNSHHRAQSASTNATGRHLNIDDARGYDWRSKPAGTSSDSDDSDEGKEKGYTQLRLDEDDESEQLHAATEYLFQDGSGGINGRHDPYGDGEGAAATPLNQMKTTKQLLSEAQKIAYVGLCSLAAAGMVKMTTRVPGKELGSAKQSIEGWKVKVMARLYQHMDIEPSEQTMIESLAVHGVLPTDLAPSLVTTQTISNPEFDPEALRERQEEEKEEREQQARDEAFKKQREEERSLAERLAGEAPAVAVVALAATPKDPTRDDAPQQDSNPSRTPSQPAGSGDEDPDESSATQDDDDAADVDGEADIGDFGDLGGDLSASEEQSSSRGPAASETKPKAGWKGPMPADDFDGDISAPAADDSDTEVDLGDLGTSTTAIEVPSQQTESAKISISENQDAKAQGDDAESSTPKAVNRELSAAADPAEAQEAAAKAGSQPILADPNTDSQLGNVIDATAALQPAAAAAAAAAAGPTDASSEGNTTTLGLTKQPEALEPPPGALDGVTTSISSADETITLDLRWTVLCDLFLVLTADSVYDARSRALLETVAAYLGLTWIDVTKFEKRITDALEIEEGVESLKDTGALDRRTQMARKKRIMMVGLATVGGGLVIGLSAGLLAPVIGAGVGAALGAVGIGGTSGFLGGVGGAALITTTGTVGGMSLGGRGMSRRTRSVKTFEFKSIHNNKRVNAIVTVPGFMSGPQDDVRLPFSVIDSIMGDAFSVLWEPDMMQEMGNALGILWNETLVQGVQQVLAATVAGAMFSALAWPLWLTKLGYLIDNPWSNALDRSRAAGYILADTLSRRQLGVRPITLVGYSLGARVIFYCLVELSRLKAYGIIQNVYIMGAPVTASDETWKEARSVVAGRFVSAFSRTDWILGYLHRAASGGLRSIAGLHPVERVQEIENVDVTHVVPGHLQYRALMPLVLSELGFKTTADYFDEPEDLTKIPERQVVREESEYELKTVETQSGGFGKIWKRKGKGGALGGNNSGTGLPFRTVPGIPASGEKGGCNSYEYDEYSNDELPPREETAAPAPASAPAPATVPAETSDSQAPASVKPVPAPISVAKAQAAAMDDPKAQTIATPEADKPPSRSVHFDTEAILEELRESGIEVKELQSSLPPLVASTTASASSASEAKAQLATPKKGKAGLELPSAAFSADRTPSPSAGKAAAEVRYQPPTPSSSSPTLSRRGSSTHDSLPIVAEPRDSDASAMPSRGPAPYARSFSTSSSLNSPSYAAFSMPVAAVPSTSEADFGADAGAGAGVGVSLSFASYDDDDIEAPMPLSEERSRAYGLSSETARELETKFRGGNDYGPATGADGISSGGLGSLDRQAVSNGWGGMATAPWDRTGSTNFGADLAPDFSGAVVGEGFTNPLAPPSQTFGGGGTINAKKSFANLDGSFLTAAASAAARGEGSLAASSSAAQTAVDPWADNPWGGGGGSGEY